MLATPIVSWASFGGSCGLQRSDIEQDWQLGQVEKSPCEQRYSSLSGLVGDVIDAAHVYSQKRKPSAGGSILAEGSTPRAPGGS
jgi:hypothetical protein